MSWHCHFRNQVSCRPHHEWNRYSIYPLDESIVNQTINIPSINEMHDRQIVATVLVIQNQGETVALLT